MSPKALETPSTYATATHELERLLARAFEIQDEAAARAASDAARRSSELALLLLERTDSA